MSDVLPQIEPEIDGRVERLDVPIGQFLSESFKAGQDQSMYRAVANTTEDQIDKSNQGARTIQPDEANKKYAIGDLKFTDPVNESLAQTMNERERQRMDHEMYLYSGATKGRFLPGMVASIAGAMANPLDFGSMFIPFVGEAGKAKAVGTIGRMLERGLIPAETFNKVPVPKLVASMAQATMWQGMAEIPRIYESHVENQPMPLITKDLLGQAAFAGILHGVGAGLKFLSDKTHEVIAKQNFNDWINDRELSGHQYIPMDEHVIQFKAEEQLRQLREEAANHIDTDMIKRDVVKQEGEYPTDAALWNRETGEKRTGPAHPLIEGYEDSTEAVGHPDHDPDKPWIRGFVTDRGRFVQRDLADQMTGSGGDFLTAEGLHAGTSDPDWLSHDERTQFDNLKEQYGYSDAEALNKVRESREQRRQQRILANPRVQAEVERQRQLAMDRWVEDQKERLKNPVSKEVQKLAAE